MQSIHHKYFWDGKNFDAMSPVFKLKRILEAATFEDMLKYSFTEFKTHISEIKVYRLWTGHKRKLLIKAIAPFAANSNSWEELFEKFINEEKTAFLKKRIHAKSSS